MPLFVAILFDSFFSVKIVVQIRDDKVRAKYLVTC